MELEISFYVAAFVAVLATLGAVTGANPMHALLYFIISLLSVAFIFFLLGAHFVAALEIIIYAGAIMVVFLFAVMLLGMGEETIAQARAQLTVRQLFVPSLLFVLLGGVLSFSILGEPANAAVKRVDSEAIAVSLFGRYALGVELASVLLLAGLVGALHIGNGSRRSAR